MWQDLITIGLVLIKKKKKKINGYYIRPCHIYKWYIYIYFNLENKSNLISRILTCRVYSSQKVVQSAKITPDEAEVTSSNLPPPLMRTRQKKTYKVYMLAQCK